MLHGERRRDISHFHAPLALWVKVVQRPEALVAPGTFEREKVWVMDMVDMVDGGAGNISILLTNSHIRRGVGNMIPL